MLSSTKSICSVFALLLLLWSGSAKAQHYGLTCEVTRQSGDYYERDAAVEKMKDLEVSSIRIPMWWDNAIRNGIFSYEIYDTALEKLNELAVPMTGVLSTSLGSKKNAWLTPSEYSEYVTNIATRYRFYISSWEVLASADIFKVNGVTLLPVQIFSTLRGVYQCLKQVNPNCQVVLGPLVRGASLDSLYALGAQKYFDAVGIAATTTPEEVFYKARTARKVMQAYGDEKPLWVTATSLSSAPGKEMEATQASMVARLYLLAAASNVEKVFWNGLRSSEKDPKVKSQFNGLYHPSFSPKPAVKAWKVLKQFCPEGSSEFSVSQKNGRYIVSWKTPEGEQIWAVWNSKADIEGVEDHNIIVEGKARFTDFYGAKLKDKELNTLGSGVVFVRGASEVKFSK